jgi:sRNA-binding carbon storage regulator CsrA
MMIAFSRKVDQWLQIGSTMFVGPTDIDKVGVRLLAKGRMIGGPEDGATFERACELGKGGELRLGPHVLVTILDIRGDAVRLGLNSTLPLPVLPKEEAEALGDEP